MRDPQSYSLSVVASWVLEVVVFLLLLFTPTPCSQLKQAGAVWLTEENLNALGLNNITRTPVGEESQDWNVTLRVAVEEWVPHVRVTERRDGTLNIQGPMAKLLDALATYLNFSKYLESNLTTKKLYSMYLSYMEWLRDTYPEEKASLDYYSDMFTKEFNISIEPPRTDTCTTCDTFDVSIKNSNSDQAVVDDLIRQKEEHQQLTQQAQDIMKKMAEDNDPETRAICVDLQQTLPTPKITASVAYYKQKMWTYNLCIHNLKTNTSSMYVPVG
ncbi:hypothetical protein Pcinc_017204 [Petrolisthes cinctipes]|uniref:Uncharacterized protein n=1 Tax=Petrolisthes cinctipes TaxID=88211 RepID=A0AAE1FPK2_PETCI|nr:hypothetical protein Pcinc_017204 [Petrolisthes cinctipes]